MPFAMKEVFVAGMQMKTSHLRTWQPERDTLS